MSTKSAESHPDRLDEPIATRELQYDSGSASSRVLVSLWKPVFEGDTFHCDYAINGLPEKIRGSSSGADSLQAIILALVGIRRGLERYLPSVSYLDEPGEHGIPMTIFHFDPSERRRLEANAREALRSSLNRSSVKRSRALQKRRERFDPDTSHVVWSTLDDAEIISELQRLARAHRAAYEAGTKNAVAFFFEACNEVFGLIQERADANVIVRRLVDDEEPLLQLIAAITLIRDPVGIAAVERLRNARMKPYARYASSVIAHQKRANHFMRREEERPKP